MVQRMLGREGISAGALAQDVGVSQPTLSRWRRQAPILGVMNDKPQKNEKLSRPPHKWTAEEKFNAVMDAGRLSEEELGPFLRENGLHQAQLIEWRTAMENALQALQGTKQKRKPTPEAKMVRDLQKELNRKDKALAEVTALLVLKKKAAEIWGDEDENTPTKKGT